MGRDYRELYRIAYNFHAEHNPPAPGPGYWEQTLDDLSLTANAHGNDKLLNALLMAVFDELEREHKKLFQGQTLND